MLLTPLLPLSLGIAAAATPPAPTGAPWPMHVIDNTSEGADGVRLADMNGDGLPDIATGWEEGNSIRAYLNPGPELAKEPWPLIQVGTVGAPEDAVLADMDGDGAVDILSCSEGNEQQVWVHWAPKDRPVADSSGAWETVAIPAGSKRTKWMFSLPADVNGDGRLDFIAGAKNEGAAIGWFEVPENPRDVAAWTWYSMREAGWIMSLARLDMNGDGHPDVVYTDRRGPKRGLGWLEHPGLADLEALRQPWKDHVVGGQDHEVMFLTSGSLEPTDRFSFLCTTRDGAILRFKKLGTNSWESQEIPMPANSGTGKGIGVGDVDKDGWPDLVISCENAEGKHGVFWLKGVADGSWRPQAISGIPGTKYDLVVLLDMDRDGDLDVLTCEEREKLGVIWYENPSQ